MKIGIDLSPTERDPAGIGQYTINLFSELTKIDSQNEYIAYTHSPVKLINEKNIVIRVTKHLPGYGLRWMSAVSRDAHNKKLDLLISPSNHLFSMLFPKTIQFIHDLAPLYYPKFFGYKASFKYNQTLKIATKKALKILTISKTIQEEILQKFPNISDRIDYIYPGLNQWVGTQNKNSHSTLLKYNIDYKYILTLGTLEPRKNHINSIKAFHLFKQKTGSTLKFVIIGKKGWFFKDIFKTVEELKLSKDVIFLGYVPNQDLNTIIKNAEAFLFMSFYEGFGIPPLEALSLDIKTLVSDIPIFREAYKDNVLYTNPNSSTDIANSIHKLITMKPRKTADFIRSNYSWEKSATKLLKIINDNK